ncbi:molybdate ABC transporter substrate-binding protein [Rubricoccus marinus]|uniref:Molybdate ABC transporter substrate-binding protein n=1 Tax=Rubricoccus marinus TaxID=716817 RepID=A0A259TZZ6_9BACT|nr:molybdate ABC transporter substrate-binding protein [Rubricoccus marinus]
MRPLALASLAFGLWVGCAREDALTVFASASAADAAQDLAEAFEGKTRISPGATSALARQIDAGAPASVALLVGDEWVDWLGSRQRLSGEPIEVSRGALAVVVPARDSAWASLRPLARVERLALADPAHVPAGRFAQAALERAGLWRGVSSRVIPFADVRAALGAVASGRADAAVVYQTDARLSNRVRTAALFPDSLVAPIVYRCAVVAGSGREAEGEAFCAHARASGETWRRRGFRAVQKTPADL